TPEMWCNSGQPVELPEVGIVGGSRFCDRLDSLANPPVTVACQPVDDTHPPGLGVCAARCEQDDGKLTDCPDEMHCSTDRDESRFGTLLPDPTNTEFGVKDCATADDCGDSRFLCEQFAAGKFCYRPFATCSYAVP
ncbi:MAG TPA: hypothetical protein VEB19_18630, partial [Gemmatimonadaceae bacterium]|nr:hypothetical protein [Gemmatimonadaceae bacterium]